jgi:hypothetical protein
METYFSEADCSERVTKLLSGDRIAPRLSEAVASALTTDLRCEPDDGSRDSFDIKVRSWVIRDEDLSFFDPLKDGLLLYLSTQSVNPIASSVVAFAVTVSRFLWGLYRRGVVLSGDSLLVFAALRRHGEPASPDTLCQALGDQWTVDRVERTLQLLTAVPSRGSPVALASRLPDGRWVHHG